MYLKVVSYLLYLIKIQKKTLIEVLSQFSILTFYIVMYSCDGKAEFFASFL